MLKMLHKITYFDFQPSVQSVELFNLVNLWSMHPSLKFYLLYMTVHVLSNGIRILSIRTLARA